MRNLYLILSLFLINTLLATATRADFVSFDDQPLDAVYGAPASQAPGDLMFTESGAAMFISHYSPGGWLFSSAANIDEPFSSHGIVFGDEHILAITDANVIFDFSSAGDVTFDYLKLSGTVNLQVNGYSAALEAEDLVDLSGEVAPGVFMEVALDPSFPDLKGSVTLSGAVYRLRVGGQNLRLDSVDCANGYIESNGCDAVVDHASLPLNATWNSATNVPGDVIFTENGIPVTIGEMEWPNGDRSFNGCQVQIPGAPNFGSGRAMNFDHASNTYDIAALGIPVRSVSFEYAHFAGLQNLQVNGATMYSGLITSAPTAVAPGVSLLVTPIPGTQEFAHRVTLVGNVQSLLIGGQDFPVDDICVVEDLSGNCDAVSDNESQPFGSTWGDPAGHVPGDVIFNENGIEVGLDVWQGFGGVMFEAASTSPGSGILGAGNVMHLDAISVTYDLSALSPVTEVSFDFVSASGNENLGLNGGVFVGDLQDIQPWLFPGNHIAVEAHDGPGYIYGTVTITGDVSRLLIGGHDFYLDNLCVVQDQASDVPLAAGGQVKLQANYPNPFNPSTTLRYSLGRAGHVQLSIVDVAGRRLATLVDGMRAAGDHQLEWNGRDDSGRRAASGVYFVQLEAGGRVAVKKIALLK